MALYCSRALGRICHGNVLLSSDLGLHVTRSTSVPGEVHVGLDHVYMMGLSADDLPGDDH